MHKKLTNIPEQNRTVHQSKLTNNQKIESHTKKSKTQIQANKTKKTN